MNKIAIVLTLFVLAGSSFSCLSPPTANNPYKPISSIPNAVVLGTVEVDFYSDRTAGYRQDNEILNETAYIELVKAAKIEYGNDVDVADVTWTDITIRFTKLNVFSASGKVIEIDQNAGVGDALARAAKNAIRNVPANSAIAIIYITAGDMSLINYVAGELEFIWVNEGYTICDRSRLEILRQEQKFSLSGEVDDSSAVGIGKFIGANVIVTGSIDGENKLRRLRLRVLNTQTGQVIGVASEEL